MHDETLDTLERTSAHHLPAAHGGELVDLYVGPERRAEIKTESRELVSWDLTPRQLCDVELLLNGAFSPLRGFMKGRLRARLHRDEIDARRSLADSDHA